MSLAVLREKTVTRSVGKAYERVGNSGLDATSHHYHLNASCLLFEGPDFRDGCVHGYVKILTVSVRPNVRSDGTEPHAVSADGLCHRESLVFVADQVLDDAEACFLRRFPNVIRERRIPREPTGTEESIALGSRGGTVFGMKSEPRETHLSTVKGPPVPWYFEPTLSISVLSSILLNTGKT